MRLLICLATLMYVAPGFAKVEKSRFRLGGCARDLLDLSNADSFAYPERVTDDEVRAVEAVADTDEARLKFLRKTFPSVKPADPLALVAYLEGLWARIPEVGPRPVAISAHAEDLDYEWEQFVAALRRAPRAKPPVHEARELVPGIGALPILIKRSAKIRASLRALSPETRDQILAVPFEGAEIHKFLRAFFSQSLDSDQKNPYLNRLWLRAFGIKRPFAFARGDDWHEVKAKEGNFARERLVEDWRVFMMIFNVNS